MTAWFGKSWGAPICDPEDHVATPVGLACLDCGDPISENDQGITMPHISMAGDILVSVPSAYHLDCWLQHILPHGPECPRCRGLKRNQHEMSCSHVKHGGDCDCPFGEDMRRLLDPKTTLAEVRNMAERVGISAAQLEDIGRRGAEHVELLKRRRATHNSGDDSGKRKAP